MYTTLQDYVIISLHFMSLDMIVLELLVCGWYWCELVHPVPVLTVDWLCHALLLVELFIDAFNFFSWVLCCLAALVWTLILRFSIPHMYTNCYKAITHTYSWISSTYIHIFNHINHRIDLLLPTCSVGNKYNQLLAYTN
jgi:hypothetical protein